jgi:hypothetical protein
MPAREGDVMIAATHRSFPGHVYALRRLEALAPPEDRAMRARMTGRALAAVACLDREAAGHPDCAAPLDRYPSAPFEPPKAARATGAGAPRGRKRNSRRSVSTSRPERPRMERMA